MKIRATDGAPGLPGVTPHNGKDWQSSLDAHRLQPPQRHALADPPPSPKRHSPKPTPTPHLTPFARSSRGISTSSRGGRRAARGGIQRQIPDHFTPSYPTPAPSPHSPFPTKVIHNPLPQKHFHHPLPSAMPHHPNRATLTHHPPNPPKKTPLFFFIAIFEHIAENAAGSSEKSQVIRRKRPPAASWWGRRPVTSRSIDRYCRGRTDERGCLRRT